MRKELKLNLGCGSNRIDGFVNVDVEPTCNPDLVIDFIKNKLPWKTNQVDEVVLFHCIEHINKRFHSNFLKEIWRVLRPSGRFLVSYPEFTACYKNWERNFRGKKEFWEATIFGRQLYPSDSHVCIMHSPDFVEVLKQIGFNIAEVRPEPLEKYNTVVYALKGARPLGYEDEVRSMMTNHKLKKVRK